MQSRPQTSSPSIDASLSFALRLVLQSVGVWLAVATLSVYAADEGMVEEGIDDESAVKTRRAAQVVESARAIANGKVTIVRTSASNSRNSNVLIHFHGAVETMRTALARTEFDCTLIIVNFSGLSSAYSKPFESDANLFDALLEMADLEIAAIAEPSAKEDRRTTQVVDDPALNITLSSFSAGYGATREILKRPKDFDRVSAIVAADSIYAGLDTERSGADNPRSNAEGDSASTKRVVSEANMRDFLRFATLASKGERTFVISHSAQPTPYASTTETADYLLGSLLVPRDGNTEPHAHLAPRDGSMKLVSQAVRGRFVVLGFAGEAANDHMQHLRNIDLLWNRCFAQ